MKIIDQFRTSTWLFRIMARISEIDVESVDLTVGIRHGLSDKTKFAWAQGNGHIEEPEAKAKQSRPKH
jgi:hypothetical protein